MTISPISGFGALNFSLNLSVRQRRNESTTFAGSGLDMLRDLARKIVDSRGALQSVRGKTGVRTLRVGGYREATVAIRGSAGPLGLNNVPTATTLKSTEEVNSTPTSFTPFAPTVNGVSTTQPIIGGVYNGAQGDDTLTFNFRRSGTNTVGQDRVVVRIRDGTNTNIQSNVVFTPSYVPGTPITLSNGLTLALTAGTAKRNDDFTVDVSTSTPSAVDPDKPLDGTLNNNPNLEYGQSVTPGSFYINATQITILSGDTLNDVLAKINASAADVNAVFNGATEEVELSRKTAGSNSITLGSDGTGFFAATKLSGATEALGLDPDPDRTFSQVSPLSGISNGNFKINGVDFAVDTSTDSLNDIIGLINASAAGVTASYNQATDKFKLTADNPGEQVTIEDGTSNFFAGLDITQGTFGGEGVLLGSKLESKLTGASELPRLLQQFAENLNSLFDAPLGGDTAGPARVATDQLRETITSVFERVFEEAGGDRLRTGLGIEFFFDQPEKGVVRIDADRLDFATDNRLELLVDFLTSDDGSKNKGLLPALDEALEEIGQSLIRDLDPVESRGLIVDLKA